MSLLTRSILINIRKLSTPHLSLTLRYNSDQSLAFQSTEKIPSNSDNLNVLEMIDQIDTRHYSRKARRKSRIEQSFANARQTKLKEMLLDESEYHPLIFKILSAQSGAEMLQILETITNTNEFSNEESLEDSADPLTVDNKYSNPSIHRIYAKAIRCCADLNDFDMCYQIFEKCKAMNIVSNELYNTLMWCEMYQNRSEHSLEKVFELYEELQQLINADKIKIKAHPRTYSTLLNSCIKVGHFSKAMQVLKQMQSEWPQLLDYARVQSAVVRLLCYINVDGAIVFVTQRAVTNESIWCQFESIPFEKVLSSLAKKVSNGGFGCGTAIEKAEDLFKKCISVSLKCNTEIPNRIFNEMMGVYANNNDYESCYALLKCLTNPSHRHKLFPEVTILNFERLLVSLDTNDWSNNTESETSVKWERIDQIWKAIQFLQLRKGINIYYVLLRLCDDKIDRAKKFYEELVSVDGLEPNMSILQYLFTVGMNHYKQDRNCEEFKAFMRFIIDQYSEYNIAPTEQIKQQWKNAMLCAETPKPAD